METRGTSTIMAARKILLAALILLAATSTAAVATEAKYECSAECDGKSESCQTK